jgi:hypothetical protein
MFALNTTWTVNLYNDPHNPQRLTDENALPPGTKIRDLERCRDTPRGDWTASAELSDGQWYRVYSWEKPQ